MRIRHLGIATTIAFTLYTAQTAFPCTLIAPPSPVAMVAGAELIVRATAIDYSVAPNMFRNGREVWTTGVPDSRVRFRVQAVLKGTYSAGELVLPGYLSSQDDWNDQTVPYVMVRRNGRTGSCFANTYRQGGQFLLVLKRTSSNAEYMVNWYALGPVNEQLRSPEDPWLLWVQEQLK